MEGLTKQKALELHRDMWLWISKEIAREKTVQNVCWLKTEYLLLQGYNNVLHDCFCCDYAYEKYTNDLSEGRDELEIYKCYYCPVRWKNEECFDEGSEYQSICMISRNGGRNGWKKQAKLAYKIAMLPEREGV